MVELVSGLYNEGEERGWEGSRVERRGLLYEEILGMIYRGGRDGIFRSSDFRGRRGL